MHQNVNILRNTFIDSSNYSIRCMNWDKPVIRDNTFIGTETPEADTYTIIVNGATNPTITENRFENINTPVGFYHWRNTGYGKEYSPIYNKLDSSYASAIKKNYMKDVVNPYCEFFNVLDDYEEENVDIIMINGYPSE